MAVIPGDPANSVYVSIGLAANAPSRPGPVDGPGVTYDANYESIEDWFDNRARNLITPDETEIAEAYDDWPGGLIVSNRAFSGFTADRDNRVILRSAYQQGPTNVYNDGFYLNGQTVRGLYVNQQHMYVRGIGVTNNGNSFSFPVLYLNGTYCGAERCFPYSPTDVNYVVYLSGNWVDFRNSFVVGGVTGIFLDTASQVFNCTIRGTSTGIQSTRNDALPQIKNNVVFATTTTDYIIAANNITGGNVDEDGTSPDSVYTITDPNSEFVGPDGSDLHILQTAGFRGLGEDLSGLPDPHPSKPIAFNDDIDGDLREVPWDCGADQFVSVVTAAQPNPLFFGTQF